MKNNQFLFFCSNFHSRDVSELWNIFFMEFTKQNPDSLSHFMFVSESGFDNISAVSEFTIAQIAIEEKIESTKISGEKDKINAYLFSLISSSSSIEKSDEESDFKSSQPDDKQKEYVHIVKMINNLIQ